MAKKDSKKLKLNLSQFTVDNVLDYLRRHDPETYKQVIKDVLEGKGKIKPIKEAKSKKVKKIGKETPTSKKEPKKENKKIEKPIQIKKEKKEPLKPRPGGIEVKFVKVNKPVKLVKVKKIGKVGSQYKKQPGELKEFKEAPKRRKPRKIQAGWVRVNSRYKNENTGETISYRQYLKRFEPDTYGKVIKWDKDQAKGVYEQFYEDHPTLADFKDCVYKKDMRVAIRHYIDDVHSDVDHPDISVLNIISNWVEKGKIFLKAKCADFDERFSQLLDDYGYIT